MKRALHWPLGGVLICALAGCQIFRDDGAHSEETRVADLVKVGAFHRTADYLPGGKVPAAESLDSVIARYEAALVVTRDPEIRRRIEARITGMELMRNELAHDSDTDSYLWVATISRYQALLARDPDAADGDELLYQLARVQELSGQSSAALVTLDRLARHYPQSRYFAEVQFRRGEMLYGQGEFDRAEAAYAAVIHCDCVTTLRRHAVYMYGWSLFKGGEYNAAFAAFAEILEALTPGSGDIDTLPLADRDMLDDTLRAVSLVFASSGGLVALEQALANRQPLRYLAELYTALADLYLEQQRYRLAADSYLHYLERYPDSAQAPRFSLQLVNCYEQAQWSALVVDAKRDYVERYGVAGLYWMNAEQPQRAELEPHLVRYLEQLARYEHQRGLDAKAAGNAARSQEALRRAAYWYELYVQTAPNDDRVAELTFLLAEAQTEIGEYPSAIEAYEWVAYSRRDPARGAEAAYAAIMAYDAQLSVATGEAFAVAHDAEVASTLRFADHYPRHPQLAAVLVDGASRLLERERYDDALLLSAMVDGGDPAIHGEGLGRQVDRSLAVSAWRIQGQAYFEQADYSSAEQAFTRARVLAAEGSESYREVADWLAASVYRQAEVALQNGDRATAASDYLRVARAAPETSLAVQGYYDAATQLVILEAWPDAEQVLLLLRERYPGHILAQGLAGPLSQIYLEQSKWSEAAVELSYLAEHSTDRQQRREALFHAAELFRDSDLSAQAISHFRRYAVDYPVPFTESVEARVQLTELYAASGQLDKRRYWQRQLMVTHDEAGTRQTSRSLYLAAQAAAELADASYQRFQQVRLVPPLQASLQAKQQAFEGARRAYDKVLSYRVAEFFSLANYRLAEVYAGLSRELLASEQPVGLSSLELEQYELMLEEQAYPFEEQAIALHQSNTERARDGLYDSWVKESYRELAVLLPVRYAKNEQTVDYSDEIN